jgi:hypothetical protein
MRSRSPLGYRLRSRRAVGVGGVAGDRRHRAAQRSEAGWRGTRRREWHAEILRLELNTCQGTKSNCGELRPLSMKPGDGAMSRSSKRVTPGCPVAEWPRRSGLALVGCNRSSTKRGRPNDGGTDRLSFVLHRGPPPFRFPTTKGPILTPKPVVSALLPQSGGFESGIPVPVFVFGPHRLISLIRAG